MHYTIDPHAVTFLNSLFEEYHNQFSIRLRLSNPATASATVALDLEATEQLKTDASLNSIPIGTGAIFFEQSQENYIHNLVIGYKPTLTGGELEIDLPFLYGDQNSFPLIDRVRLYFQKEIQPALDAHRGHAVVKNLTEENDLVIAFSGGCQGCSLASVTLKNLIDEKIREHFPQIRNIIDSTNHSAGERPYA
jgi:Fe/S biogenesis protein NfuA